MQDISIWQFLILGLAVFRVTRLIVYDQITDIFRSPFLMETEEISESGEKEVFLIPRKDGLRGWIGELISCYWCTGVWVSIFVFFLFQYYPLIGTPFVYISAIAGLAAIIETIVQTKIFE